MKKKFNPFICFFIFLLQFKLISQTTYDIECELDSKEKTITKNQSNSDNIEQGKIIPVTIEEQSIGK